MAEMMSALEIVLATSPRRPTKRRRWRGAKKFGVSFDASTSAPIVTVPYGWMAATEV
jgi:hypothetical protein